MGIIKRLQKLNSDTSLSLGKVRMGGFAIALILLLGIGDTGQGLWMLVASCVVYGVAFDFFNIAGGIYMDSMADKGSRASAQGLFMAAATGIGGSCGILIAQRVVNALVFSAPTPEAQHAGWVESWLVFAAYMAVVALMFALLFRPRRRQQG